jgi:hypothetical protein
VVGDRDKKVPAGQSFYRLEEVVDEFTSNQEDRWRMMWLTT